MKILIVTHFNLAEGFKDSLRYFIGDEVNKITTINAYVDNDDPKDKIKAFVEENPDEKLIIFTDILNGSVNQYTIPFLDNERVFVITGINLPTLLEASMFSDHTTFEDFKNLEAQAQNSIVFMNNYEVPAFDEDDE